MQYVKSEEDADEIVNDAFLVLWEKKDDLVLDESIKPFLYTIVKNKSLNLLKKRKIELSDLDPDFEVASLNATPLEALQAQETEEVVYKLIEALPPRCKQIFILSRKENLRNKEIADLMGLNEKTVENQISIAIKFIRVGLRNNNKEGNTKILIFPWLMVFLLN